MSEAIELIWTQRMACQDGVISTADLSVFMSRVASSEESRTSATGVRLAEIGV